MGNFVQSAVMLSRFLPENFSIQMAAGYVLCCQIGVFWSSFGNILGIAHDYFEKKLLIFNFKKGLENGFVFSNTAEKSSNLWVLRECLLKKKGTILKADKLNTISNSFIKIISFVLNALASDYQTIQIGRTAGPCYCHLSKTNLQPTEKLDIPHH